MSHAEGAAVEQADALEYDYSCGDAAVEEGGWGTQEQAWDDGTYSYGYDAEAAPQSHEGESWPEENAAEDAAWTQDFAGTETALEDHAPEDAAYTQDIVGTETALEEWQWVEDPASGGYYYNAVTGETRWDDPAALEETNSQALVEYGFQNALGHGADVSNGAVGADESVLTEVYGEESYVFTADDGTVWRFDAAAGDYVQEQQQQQEDELAQTADSEMFGLDPPAGSPWQRVDTEQGPYYFNTHTQETSWELPQETEDSTAVSQPDSAVVAQSWEAEAYTEFEYDGPYDGGAPQQADGSTLTATTDDGGMNDDRAPQQSDGAVLHASADGAEVPSLAEVEASLSAVLPRGSVPPTENGSGDDTENKGGEPHDGDAPKQSNGSILDAIMDDADGAVVNLTGITDDAGVQSSMSAAEVSPHGSAPATETSSRRDGSKGSERAVADIASIAGVDNGTFGDQASMGAISTWSAEKLREISKALPGEWLVSDFLLDRATEDYSRMLEMDDLEIEAIKSKGTSRVIRSLVGPEEGEDDVDDEVSIPSGEEGGDSDRASPSAGAAQDGRSVASAVASASSEELLMKINPDGGEGRRERKRRSILGLKQASAGSKEGLGAWKPGFAMDGSAYFVHQETGESAWTYPIRAWEVKANQLGLLTPRAPLEVGRGVCRLRETEAMRKKRISYRWKVEQQKEKEVVRRRENPTPEEAAETAVEEIIAAIEWRDRRERRLVEHNARVKERARWHPSTGEYLMQKLVFPSASTPTLLAAGGTPTDMEAGVNHIVTDADFIDVKLTQAGSTIPWGPKAEEKKKTLPAPIKVLPKTSSFAKLRFDLPAMIHGGLPHAPSLPRLPSVKTLSKVRSLNDLKRELNAGFASSVKQGKSAMSVVHSKVDVRSKGALKTVGEAKLVLVSARAQPKIDDRGKGALKIVDVAKEASVPVTEGEESAVGIACSSMKSPALTDVCPTDLSLTDLSPPPASGDDNPATAPISSTGMTAEQRQEEDIIQRSNAEEDRPGPAVRDETHEAGSTNPSTTVAPSRTVPPQLTEAATAASLKGEQGQAIPRNRGKEPPPEPPGKSEETARAPTSTAGSRRSATNDESEQAMHNGQEGGGTRQHPDTLNVETVYNNQEAGGTLGRPGGGNTLGRSDALSGSVALAAVASLDKQVRGLGVMLALKMEGGDSANYSHARTAAFGSETLVAAKTSLIRVGKAIGLRKQSQPVATSAARDPAKVSLPPPDTSRVTLRLACKPPPFNLLTTVRVKDPATGKGRDHDILTSVLRDAWERILVRDVATAGGVDERQVLIEEVRRCGGPFPLEISRRQEELFCMAGTLSSDSALPFRPARCNDTCRNLARTTPTAPPTGELVSLSAPQLGLETKMFSDGGNRPAKADFGNMHRSEFTGPLASTAPLPSAGIRAVLARRLLSGSMIKRRRRGHAVSGGGLAESCRGARVELGGGGATSTNGGTETAEMGTLNNRASTALTHFDLSSNLRHDRKGHRPSSGDLPMTDEAATAMDTEHRPSSDGVLMSDKNTATDNPVHADTATAIYTSTRAPVSETPTPRQEVAPTPTQDMKPPSTQEEDQGENKGEDKGGKTKRSNNDDRGEGEHTAPPSGKQSVALLPPTGRHRVTTPGPATNTTEVPEVPASTSPGGLLPPMTNGGEGERASASLKLSVVSPPPNGRPPITTPAPVAATIAVPEAPASNASAPLPLTTNGDGRERARAPWKGSVAAPPSMTGLGRLITAPSSIKTMPVAPEVPGSTSRVSAPGSMATMPSIATLVAAPKVPGSNSGGPFIRTADGRFSVGTGVSREKSITPGGQGERGDAAGTLGLDNIYGSGGEVDGEVHNGEIARARNEVAKRISFADKTTADDIAVGIGAGNRGDWGILGRVKKNGGRVLGSLRYVEGMVFENVDDGRKQDPAVQEALQATLRGDRLMKTWQAKDSVMKAMDHRERIPTIHELKLAGRVERARALFCPGGYLPQTLAGEPAQGTPYNSAAVVGGAEQPPPTLRQHEGIEGPREALSPEVTEGEHDRRVVAPNLFREDRSKIDGEGDVPSFTADNNASAQLKPGVSSSKREPRGISEDLKRTALRPPLSNATGKLVTIVTLTIIGGGTGSRRVPNPPQTSKTPSEAVAQSIALQAGAEGSDLLRGGLTHTTLSAHWCAAGRGRVMDTWEGYWCHIISPAFFGRSVRARHTTKAEARRRREDAVRQKQKTDFLASEEEEKPGSALASSASPVTNIRLMSLNEQLEHAELQYQELLAEGLADGRRLNPNQYRARKARDRAIKKVLLRRKIKAKRKSGGLIRTRFPYRRLPSDELNGWQAEIVAEDQAHRAQRREEDAVRRVERVEDSRKRGERNKLKTWILRHLVANNGDADLMAKAIALHHDEDNLNGVGSASKGAVGRESFISGRNMRPGGRFAYGLEASAQEMKKKDTAIKGQRRFEQDTDSLLREIFRVVHSSWQASLPQPSSTRDLAAANVEEQPERSLVQSNTSSSKDHAAPVTVSEESRKHIRTAATGGGGGGGSGRVSSDSTHTARAGSAPNAPPVLTIKGGPAAASAAAATEKNKNSPSEGTRTGAVLTLHTASRTVPVAMASITSHGALPPAQDKDMEQSTLTTTPLKSVGGGRGRIAGGDGGGREGGDVRRKKRGTDDIRTPPLNDDDKLGEEGGEGDNRNPVLKEEAALSVPRSELLRALRQSGLLRRKAMTSDAVRPILCDRDFTEAFLLHPCATSEDITENELALFGSVTAEVDRWYKRVRATLDPVRAVSESRVKSFETRKERGRQAKAAREKDKADGLAPSDAWRRQLNVTRKTNRGDGRGWSRFHHHVLIRTSPHLPLYCCLCRRRKWDEARVTRLKAEHAVRASWGRVLSERQEILEPLVQEEIRTALYVEEALRDEDEGAWAVMHCLKSLVAAVPDRVESLEAAGDVIERVLGAVMRESCSFEERTRKRRNAALAKLRALEGMQTANKGRRRSRRVSVGPTGFAVTPQGNAIVSSPVLKPGLPVTESGRKMSVTESGLVATETGAGAVETGVEKAVAPGTQEDDGEPKFVAAGSSRRGFAEFSEQAQATARGYYSAPQGTLGAEVRGTVAWDRLKEAWFQQKVIQSDVWEDERAFALEACTVEVLEGERRTWEGCEWERRGMFAEDELQRRGDESLRRTAEAAPRERQEAGQRAFCAVLDTMERRSQSLARLRWEFIADFQDMQNMTCRVRDAATGKRYVCRFLPCRGPEEVAVLLREAYRVQEIRNSSLVKVHSAHPHRIATYDERGVQTTGGEVVLVLLEFCPGGSIEDHLDLLRGAGNGTIGARTPCGRGDRDRNSFQTKGDRQGSQTIGLESKNTFSTGAIPSTRAEDKGHPQRASINSVDANERNLRQNKVLGNVGVDRMGATAPGVPAHRLEVWVRQVAHGLSALHAEGGIHRNINAGNVYLDQKRRAKLGGYQCLKVPSQSSPGPLGMLEGFGSVTTAPPEYELCGETSAKGDMWSLGCALFKWTTGKEFAYLAAGARLQEMLHLVPPSYGTKIKTALFMCLQRDPGVRVSSADLWKFMSTTGDDRPSHPTPAAAAAVAQ